MKKSLVLLALALIAAAWALWPKREASSVSQASPSHLRSSAVKPAAALPSSPVEAPSTAFVPSEKTLQQWRSSTDSFYKNRRAVDRDQQAEQQYAARATEPEAVRLATHIIGDPEAATQFFAQDQAYARVFAVGLLDFMAKQGQLLPLEETLHRVGEKLSGQGSRAQGVDADYVDLLSSYIRHIGPETILEAPEAFLQKISYSQGLALEVEKAFYDSGILRDLTPDQKKKLQPYFAQTEGK